MSSPAEHTPWRVLVVDDEYAVLQTYREALASPSDEITALVEELLAESPKDNFTTQPHRYQLEVAQQGEEGVALAQQAIQQQKPFAVAFVDIRMPPGIDGRETALQLRQLDPSLYIVIVSAYSDYSPQQIRQELGHRMVFMRKPFLIDEIEQLAYSFCENWVRDHQLALELESNLNYQHYLQGVFDALPVPVSVIDVASKRVIQASRVVAGSGDNSQTCYQLFHHADGPCDEIDHGSCPMQRVVAERGPVMVEHTHYNSDGEERLYEVHAAPLFNTAGEVVQILEFSVDETERIALLNDKERLLRQQRSLFNMFRSSAHTMRNALDYLKGIMEMVALERSNPVALAELLSEDRIGLLNSQLDVIDTLQRGALSNARESAITYGPLPIAELLQQAIALFSITKRGAGRRIEQEIKLDVATTVTGTRSDLITVLLNLLNNAADEVARYQQELLVAERYELLGTLQEYAEIRVTGTVLESATVELRIANMGAVLQPTQWLQLFERGYSTKESGNGVGLADVEAIVTEMQGEIMVSEYRQGEPDQGSCFVLSFPCNPCRDKESPTIPKRKQSRS